MGELGTVEDRSGGAILREDTEKKLEIKSMRYEGDEPSGESDGRTPGQTI
jgi:hypothetical protein